MEENNTMKKLFVLGCVITSFLFVLFFGFNVNAEEAPESTETPTQEVENAESNEGEEEKINKLVDFVQSLNEDELVGMINEVKTWFISLGIVGIVGILTAVISLIAAITKLRNEKIRNSNLTKEEAEKRVEDNNKTQDTIVKECDNIKLLLLDFMNGLEDGEKEQVKSNIANVKARLLELKNDDEE